VKRKELTLLLLASLLIFALFEVSFAGDEVTGTVSKIEGNTVTIIASDTKKEVVAWIEDPGSFQNLRVGDKVVVRYGKLVGKIE